jgi:hypothetical protein
LSLLLPPEAGSKLVITSNLSISRQTAGFFIGQNMIVEKPTFIQQVQNKAASVRFYTPSPAEQFTSDSPKDLESLKNSHFEGLVKQLTIPFGENSSVKNKQLNSSYTDRISFFTNGDRPYSPFNAVNIPKDVMVALDPDLKQAQNEGKELRNAVANRLMEQAKKVVAFYCADYFSPDTADGFASEADKRKFFNMREIAPQIVRILSDRDNYISMVAEEHALNIVAAALHMVRYPETQMVIRVGIGGSDDKLTTARFPAYAIPPLRIAEQVNNIYEERKRQKMKVAAFEKVIQEREKEKGKKLEKNEKREIDQQIPVDETSRYEEILTNKEYESALQTYSIAQNPVKIQFAFAHEAAIAINETKNPEEIRRRTDENMHVLDGYIDSHFPSQQDNVEYIVDKPWSEHSKHITLQMEYLSSILRERRKEDPTIDQTLSILERMGVGHGGEKGKEEAAVYAAAHPFIFRDRVNLPFANYYQPQDGLRETSITQNPHILLTIGGEPERQFCAIREFLAKEANPEGFKEFIQKKAEATTDEQEKSYYTRIIRATQRWQQIVDTQRKNIGNSPNNNSQNRADFPIHVIPLITKIGEKPVYYATPSDEPYGVDLNQHINNVTAKVVALKTERGALLANPNRTDDEERRIHNEIILTQGIEYDLNVLVKEEHRNGKHT